MHIICNQGLLSEAINIVQKAVSSKSTMPILKGILVEAKDGFIRMVGNDLNIGIETRVEGKILTEGATVISSRIFGEIVRKLPGDDVSFFCDATGNIQISSDQSTFNLIGQPAEEFPSLPTVDPESTCNLECDLLRNMIKQTVIAISQDESRPILTGSLIETENGIMTMVSIDGYRLALRKAKIGFDHHYKAVVPGKTLNELGKILQSFDSEKSVHVTFANNHIMFNIDNIRIISRLLEGEFIKYAQIMPTEYKTKITLNTSELLDSTERASLMVREGKNSSVKVAVGDKRLIITSNAEIGSVNEQVPINLEGQELEIGFNPKYLIDALKVMDTEDIIMEFTTPVSPCIMKPYGDDSYIYLVLPVRMSN